ncbi:MAG TPA: cysteine desulfurase family protein [Aestuariivirgaceae bacterium]|nr:cysteine desulfurase family protein [Aestuariivirgaceae bacterium]
MALRTYLDHNATSPLRGEAREAMIAALDAGGNASSVHREGRAARALVDEARETIALALGCLPDMIVFTASGTEANNLALKGAAGLGARRLVVSAVEHASVLETAAASGLPADIVPVVGDGRIDLAALEQALAGGDRPALVSVMAANNETGAIMPLAEVAEIARRHGALVHSDAVQAPGKLPLRWAVLDVDLMSVSAHKLGGPQGAGALVVREGLIPDSLLHGGGQELKRRAGTENVAAIAGFAAALRAADEPGRLEALRHRLEVELKAAAPDVTVFAEAGPRLPNTTCFALPGLEAATALMGFDLAGIAVSSGSACSSGKVSRSHVLAAMGVAPELAVGAIRASLGWNSTLADVERFAAAWSEIVAGMRDRAAA